MITDNQQENRTRQEHTYEVGDFVQQAVPKPRNKLVNPWVGHYPVVRVFDNGTVSIWKGTYFERLNVCQISPIAYLPFRGHYAVSVA